MSALSAQEDSDTAQKPNADQANENPIPPQSDSALPAA